jgi:hypothetical protein
MRWLRVKIRNWLNNHEYADTEYVESKRSRIGLVTTRDNHELDGEPIRFQVYRASGGMVIQTHVYDRIKDRSHQRLHIIGDGADLGREIDKIITMELLRG